MTFVKAMARHALNKPYFAIGIFVFVFVLAINAKPSPIIHRQDKRMTVYTIGTFCNLFHVSYYMLHDNCYKFYDFISSALTIALLKFVPSGQQVESVNVGFSVFWKILSSSG